jgi:hypothetical protein
LLKDFLYIGDNVIRMILDSATMRVIYYTADYNENIALIDRTLCYDYEGELPTGMSLSNSWNYRLAGNQLVNTMLPAAKKPSLLDSNRKEAQRLLVEKINQSRKTLMPTCDAGDWVRELKLEDSEFLAQLAQILGQQSETYSKTILDLKKQREQQLKNSELNRFYYRQKISRAQSNEEIIAIRDEFANADLLTLQIK